LSITPASAIVIATTTKMTDMISDARIMSLHFTDNIFTDVNLHEILTAKSFIY